MRNSTGIFRVLNTLNQFQCTVACHIETSHLICIVNQMNCFYVTCNTGLKWVNDYATSIYLFKVNNRNSRKRYEICSKLKVKIPERRHWRRSGVLNVICSVTIKNFLETLPTNKPPFLSFPEFLICVVIILFFVCWIS